MAIRLHVQEDNIHLSANDGENIPLRTVDVVQIPVSSYSDLADKPSINNVELDGVLSLADLGIVIPTVPTNVSSFNNDAGYLTLSTLPIYDGGVE